MEQVKIKLSVLGYEVAVLVLEIAADIDNTISTGSLHTKGVKRLSRWWTQEMAK